MPDEIIPASPTVEFVQDSTITPVNDVNSIQDLKAEESEIVYTEKGENSEIPEPVKTVNNTLDEKPKVVNTVNRKKVQSKKTVHNRIQDSRITKTSVYSAEEMKYLDHIYQARLASKLSRDWNHFIRQCVDFACNGRMLHKAIFGVPAIKPEPLNDAFVKPSK